MIFVIKLRLLRERERPGKKHCLNVCSQSRHGPCDVLILGKLLVVVCESPKQVGPGTAKDCA